MPPLLVELKMLQSITIVQKIVVLYILTNFQNFQWLVA
jgi:hypothetical protein